MGSEEGTRLLLVSSNNPSNRQAARWFLDAVFPKVQEKHPGVRLTVVGGLAAELNDQPGLERVGPVVSLDAVYAHATAVINPVRVGTGLKIKTLEALAHGKPLVTTRVGGEGLEDGWADAFLVADSPDDFADAVCGLLTNPDDARALARRARCFAEHSNRQSYHALESLLESHSV